MHPVVAWSLIHVAWARNHFAVQGGQTPFERAFARSYNGRVFAFGEVVLGYVRSSKKGVANWRNGIWLTKSTNSDVHVIAFGEHVLCTRSIRRLPKQWDLTRAGDVSAEPWCFGLANLGSKPSNSKRVAAPKLLTYALDGAGTPDEAASDPPSPRGPGLAIFDSTTLDELAQSAPMSGIETRRGKSVPQLLNRLVLMSQLLVILQWCRNLLPWFVKVTTPNMKIQIVQQRPQD